MVEYINYARRKDIVVLPPDINSSREGFSIEGYKIRFSLGHVKNVAKAAESIVSQAPFADMGDFYERVDRRRCNKRVVESLISAGAFDCFGDRNAMLQRYYELRGKKKEQPASLCEEEWVKREKEVIHLCLSREPLVREYAQQIAKCGWVTLSKLPKRKRADVFGRVESIQSKTSQKGNPMLVCEISDGLDNLQFYVFQGERNYFTQHVKRGYVVVLPMKRFEDGNAWFFSGHGKIVVVAK